MTVDPLAGRTSISVQELQSLPAKLQRSILGSARGGGDTEKYGNRKTLRHGLLFDSAWEADCWDVFLLQQKAGLIKDLDRQKVFELIIISLVDPNIRTKVGYVQMDFIYTEVKTNQRVVADAKSVPTAMGKKYRLQKKVLEALYGFKVLHLIKPDSHKAPRPTKAPRTGKGRRRAASRPRAGKA